MRRIASAVAASVVLLGIGAGVSHAATVPKGTPSKAVVVEQNSNGKITDYKLKNAGPMTGVLGAGPLGNAEMYALHWTKVGQDQVTGTGKYIKEFMGDYRSGPVTILLTGSKYKYTRISITLTQSWYGHTTGMYPPYGHGAHHTNKPIKLAVNIPTTKLLRG